jgi:hypothetical protein
MRWLGGAVDGLEERRIGCGRQGLELDPNLHALENGECLLQEGNRLSVAEPTPAHRCAVELRDEAESGDLPIVLDDQRTVARRADIQLHPMSSPLDRRSEGSQAVLRLVSGGPAMRQDSRLSQAHGSNATVESG